MNKNEFRELREGHYLEFGDWRSGWVEKIQRDAEYEQIWVKPDFWHHRAVTYDRCLPFYPRRCHPKKVITDRTEALKWIHEKAVKECERAEERAKDAQGHYKDALREEQICRDELEAHKQQVAAALEAQERLG